MLFLSFLFISLISLNSSGAANSLESALIIPKQLHFAEMVLNETHIDQEASEAISTLRDFLKQALYFHPDKMVGDFAKELRAFEAGNGSQEDFRRVILKVMTERTAVANNVITGGISILQNKILETNWQELHEKLLEKEQRNADSLFLEGFIFSSIVTPLVAPLAEHLTVAASTRLYLLYLQWFNQLDYFQFKINENTENLKLLHESLENLENIVNRSPNSATKEEYKKLCQTFSRKKETILRKTLETSSFVLNFVTKYQLKKYPRI